jgi:hypothetical protein
MQRCPFVVRQTTFFALRKLATIIAFEEAGGIGASLPEYVCTMRATRLGRVVAETFVPQDLVQKVSHERPP